MEEERRGSTVVCVTGGGSYIGSLLLNKLLRKGYTVHSTLTNLKDESKIGLLIRGFGEAIRDERLVLFEANIYKPEGYEAAIQGCEFVFHVATPYRHQTDSQRYEKVSEAAIGGVKSIAEYCIKSGTVRRLIYTGSVVAASPLKQDASAYKHFIDETCWTPLNLDSFTHLHKEYTDSKTLAERELLSYGNRSENGKKFEVVSLACGLVGGDNTLLNHTPLSVSLLISQLKNNETNYQSLRFLEDLDGKVPIVHVHDVCEAHIFCAENPSIHGRFLVASSYASSSEIANYYSQNYPEFNLEKKYFSGPERVIKWNSTKLRDKGFVYKYDFNMILDDCIRFARRTGYL